MVSGLIERSNWNGEDIMLMACEAGVGGEDSPAARLADALDCTVWGPSDLFWICPNGLYYINDTKVIKGNLDILAREEQEKRWIEY